MNGAAATPGHNGSPPQELRADGAARRPYQGAVFAPPFTVSVIPKAPGHKRLGRSPSGPSKHWLTFPKIYVIYRAAMESIQMRALRAATGGVPEGRRKNAEWGAYSALILALRAATVSPRRRWSASGHYWGLLNGNAKGLSDRNTFLICDTDERGSELEENVRLCSLMFAYVRLCSLNGKKNV